ncbi:immunoglobulin domain-containing protein [Phthorimaea operculella]|nr:immunoglobulin domain-containing protein [Phthorimaea operculella]
MLSMTMRFDLYRRVLDNGTLHILPALRPSQVSTTHMAVRCRVTNLHGAIVSPPIYLHPVWDEASLKVEANAVKAGGVAALHCVGLETGERSGSAVVRWWWNESPLLATAPTPNAQYVLAGERGEWLLFDNPVSGDRFSCQITGAGRSPPVILHVTESMPGEIPRLALSQNDVNVLTGSDFCLPCAAPDHPPPHYTWYRESDGRLVAASEAGAWSWRGGAALCFSRVTSRAAGAWLCRASSARGDATARARLTVRHPLSVTLTPALTIAGGGDTVRLECQTNDPEATISWLHMGAPSVMGGDVTALGGGVLLLRVTPRTRGLWQCEAKRGSDIEQATAELRLAEAAPELRYTFIEQALRGGARVSLRCAAVGAPPPHFTWRRDDMPLETLPTSHRYLIGEERIGAGEVVSTLNISATAPEDGGRYSCRAENQLGHVEHSARLNIYGPPLVRSTPPQRALAGENVTLLCPYAGYPISSVTWQRGSVGGKGVGVGNEGRIKALGAALELRPALASDAGRYSCRVEAPDGAAATGDVMLLVLNPPKISPFVFSSELSEGNSVRVICSVSSGDSPFSFSWLKDGAPLTPDLQIEETSLDDFSLLKFGRLSERHSGAYTCRVTNSAASVDYTATLHVRVPPTWTREPLDTALSVGAPLRLECAARGEPPPTVTWHRREQCREPAECSWRVVHGNGTLWATAAPRDLAGLYRCTADNGVGPPLQKHINISIFEPAQIDSANELVNSTCVHSLTGVCALACVARGDDPLTITWSHASRPLDMHSGRVSVSESRAGDGALRSELSVRAVTAADAGEYRCRATNARGRSERLFILNVEEPPAAPNDLRLSGRSARRVRLSWRGPRSLRYSAVLEQLRAPHPTKPDIRDLILDSHDSCSVGWSCASLSGLQAGAAYSVRVRAASRAGLSPLSAPLLFTTLEDAPSGAPQDLRVKSSDQAELHVSWSPPPRATWNGELLGYVVSWRVVEQHGERGEREKGEGRAVRRGAGTALVLRSLRPRDQYAVTVRAFNRAGAGPPSTSVLAYTSEGDLDAPLNVRCAGVSAYQLRVLWAADPRHRPFEVLYAPTFPESGVWSESDEEMSGGWRARAVAAAGGAGEARLAGLRAGTTYSVWLRARLGAAAPPVSCSTMPAAGAVAVVQARGVSAAAVRVWWRAPADAPPPDYYTVHARDLTRSESEWSQRVEGGGEMEVSRVVSGLRARGRYEFWVRAHSSAGAGPPSPRVLAAPHPPAEHEAVRIWSFPHIVIAAVGANVRFRCAADGSPPLRRRWSPLPPQHAITVEGHLDILGVQLDWAGNYTTAGHEPIPPAASEFVWVNSSAARLLLLSWDAPCGVTAWRAALRADHDDAWRELQAPGKYDDVLEVGEMAAGSWYEVRVTARWTGGSVVAHYRLATLTIDGDRIGESLLLPAEENASAGAALWPAALAATLASLTVVFSLLVWRITKRTGKWRRRRVPPTQSLRPRDELPPPPLQTLDYTLPTKCDISDIRVMSARLSIAGSLTSGVASGAALGGCDSASDSSGEPCAACQRAAITNTPANRYLPCHIKFSP